MRSICDIFFARSSGYMVSLGYFVLYLEYVSDASIRYDLTFPIRNLAPMRSLKDRDPGATVCKIIQTRAHLKSVHLRTSTDIYN